jgi:HK97 family phage portal protein
LKWRIKPKDESDNSNHDDDIAAVTSFFEYPDKQNSWSTWLRAVLEDLLVLDAPCLYPRFLGSGALYSLEVVDGATIKVLINEDGRTPEAPNPAYQQILHGVVAANYTRDELLYLPRNFRSNRMYGYSIIEQIITTVNIALRRQASQLDYYTAGSVPDALASVPESWTPNQIGEFQQYWDAINSGSMAERRKLKFIPGGINYQPTKDSILKDDYDDWLARVVCYAFGISAQALQQQMNRASAETSKQIAEQEGLAPFMQWIANMINKIIVKYMGITTVEFSWEEEVETDALKQAQVNEIYVKLGIKSVDEVRSELGLQPIGMANAIYTAMGVQLVGDVAGQYLDTPAEGVDVGQPRLPNPEAVQEPALLAAPNPASGAEKNPPVNPTTKIAKANIKKKRY